MKVPLTRPQLDALRVAYLNKGKANTGRDIHPSTMYTLVRLGLFRYDYSLQWNIGNRFVVTPAGRKLVLIGNMLWPFHKERTL